ncbi:MAG TPA: ABC transporter ATP-binding protein [Candidatus Tectomicrobia bacterium]|nr:ABC transporter ATP-binding protein [Candidatus Tectomicrobia bacterium]
MLELQDVHSYYGNIHALKGPSLRVGQGEIVTLIGANGAGKSTTIRTVTGLLRPRHGQITLEGERIERLLPHLIVQRGVAQAPEGRRIFPRLTVRENLEMGAYTRTDVSAVRSDLDRVLQLFPRLKERASQQGGTLSGGEQQMLAIGRALMARPRLLLLDEPSMGLAPTMVEVIFQTIQEINRQGTTILLVEQNALMALEVAHRGYVLQTGRTVLHDSADNLLKNEMVRKVYLGIDESAPH